MELTNEEKQLFKVDKKETFDTNYIEEYLLNIYNIDNNEEQTHNLNVTLDLIKRMIIEISNKNEFGITGNESYDTDNLINEIIDEKEVSYNELLVNFDPKLYKDSDKLNKYFYELTKDKTFKELKSITQSFNGMNDNFRAYFASHFTKLVDLARELYYKTSEKEDYEVINIVDDNNNTNNEMIESETTNKANNELSDDFFKFDEWASDDSWMNEIIEENTKKNKEETIINKETLTEYTKFINAIDPIIEYRKLGYSIIRKLRKLTNQTKLKEFYSNEKFMKMFNIIMEHDRTKCSYYFHGTQCVEDAESILNTGLGMARESLESTAYKELTKDEAILYERGLGGEIGRDAIVIINVPKNSNGEELNVVTKLDNPDSIPFVQSGLQGLNSKPNYIVLPENIVGYINKHDKKIVFNPKYYNYENIDNNQLSR